MQAGSNRWIRERDRDIGNNKARRSSKRTEYVLGLRNPLAVFPPPPSSLRAAPRTGLAPPRPSSSVHRRVVVRVATTVMVMVAVVLKTD
jgi:hypothetical protein